MPHCVETGQVDGPDWDSFDADSECHTRRSLSACLGLGTDVGRSCCLSRSCGSQAAVKLQTHEYLRSLKEAQAGLSLYLDTSM